MAPNRKNVASLIQTFPSSDLQSLQNAIQPKFLPLTHPSEEKKSTLHKPKKPQAGSSASYWDWPADVEQEPIDVLSLSNIESNLIQAANANAAVAETKSEQVPAHDDYWDDQVERETASVVFVNKPQHVESPYWAWPADQDSKQATIESILIEEKAYRLVSGVTSEMTEKNAEPCPEPHQVHATKASNDQYWKWEAAEVASHVLDDTHPNGTYWEWNKRDEKVALLRSLLEHEAARRILAVDNIVRQLQSQKASRASCIQERFDDYWTVSEGYGDQYWEAQQTPVAATGTGYWNW